MNPSILDSIGNTPLVEIKRLNPNPDVKILAKLEYFNPGGSIKDRAASAMIEAGEKSGELTSDKIVLEATSGNTGIGLALICSVKGYSLLLTMSEMVSLERQKILKARGADILLTPGHLGTDGAIEEVYRLMRENPERYFISDQFNNEANWKAHYHGTAQEIWDQTDGQITTLVATLGTSGTLMGVSRKLKELNPKISIIGVEPYLGHKIQGLKNMKEAYRPEIFEKQRIDQKLNIDDEDAFAMTRRLAREEGLLVGMSSGAAMVIAAQIAKTMTGGLLVVIFPDSGERYLSTPLFDVPDRVELRFYNTMTRRKEPFVPIKPSKASIYSCGPTAYAPLNLSECRRYIFADLLCRYLEFRSFDVTHIMNMTDLDDKTIQGSDEAGMSLPEFTEKHIRSFMDDFKTLLIKPATEYPRSSEHTDAMVQMTQKLFNKSAAYEKLKSVYFNISRSGDYGRLSGVDIQKIKLGATVDLDEYEKDNPRDFTLLKRVKLSELKRGIFVKTDWGNVRPSWHLQCAAISAKYLGDSFDIHTASRELCFPHHENKIAIAEALNRKSDIKYWMHCDRVLPDGKRADTNGDILTLKDLSDRGYSGREVRFWLLATHYRKSIVFDTERLEHLEHARNTLKRIDYCISRLLNVKTVQSQYSDTDQLLYDIKQGFITAMDDDLNISAALASIFKMVKKINILMSDHLFSEDDARRVVDAFRQIDEALHIFNFDLSPENAEIQEMIAQRNQARQEKNWVLADSIRDRLIARGIAVQDGKTF
ncbi:cysteine synthase [Desulfococcaceae bacterium HSG7]|nr:cysteine synthase [Desulfococcaceae bacterium HSG7]